MTTIIIAAVFGGLTLAVIAALFLFRRVVEPNEVHIVQSTRGSIAYGVSDASGESTSSLNGNSYYEWPTFLPFIGVQVKVLPLAVFQLDLTGYDAYDIGKVPFRVDVVGFFRIDEPATAAKRITTIKELRDQLTAILQGAVRTILAKHEIEDIMMDRSTFGELFTAETHDQLKAWGVRNVKNIELMDIRDGHDSEVVGNIMAKKESLIDRESRTVVAENKRAAEVSEIEAQRGIDVQTQQAAEVVGLRTAAKEQAVGVAAESAKQEILSEATTTKEREMEVVHVGTVRQAEITKAQQVVGAEQQRETTNIRAEGTRQETVIVAEGQLEERKREAEGTLAIGTAEAEAERLNGMAAVSPQIELAREIGENEGYQTYLISVRQVEATENVGVAQAKALEAAGIKVIANTGGGVTDGVNSIGELFTSKGGTSLGAAVEAFAQTPQGAEVLRSFGVRSGDAGGATNGAARAQPPADVASA